MADKWSDNSHQNRVSSIGASVQQEKKLAVAIC